MSIQLFFFPFFLVIFVQLILVLLVLYLVAVNSLSPHFFLCNLRVVVLIYRRYLDCRQVFFHFLFLTHTVCQSYLWNVKPYATSLVFLFSRPFVGDPLWFSSRMVPSILRRVQARYLSLWWEFCYVVWFRVVFLFFWGIPFYFFFHLRIIIITIIWQ